MKPTKRNTVITAVIILFAVLICILIFMISEPRHGRKFTIHIVDTIVLQSDPPTKKLIKYMEEKYNREFTPVNAEFSLYSLERRNHDWGSAAWDYLYNGITVKTDNNSNEYYHVRDNYGTYLDNYGCYLINDEAETELNKKISHVLTDKELKAACFPNDFQCEELPAHMTVQEYLDNANFSLCIVICGKGENAQNDYESVCQALNAEDRNIRIFLIYFDKNVYDNIDMNDYQAIISNESYNNRII